LAMAGFGVPSALWQDLHDLVKTSCPAFASAAEATPISWRVPAILLFAHPVAPGSMWQATQATRECGYERCAVYSGFIT